MLVDIGCVDKFSVNICTSSTWRIENSIFYSGSFSHSYIALLSSGKRR